MGMPATATAATTQARRTTWLGAVAACAKWLLANPRAWEGWPTSAIYDTTRDMARLHTFRLRYPSTLPAADDRAFQLVSEAVASARVTRRAAYERSVR